jgi:hypothetical protein
MHDSGLNDYEPRKEHHLTLVNTVSENKTGFTKRQITSVELAQNMYKTLSYPSMKDFKCVIISNQLKDFPVMIQDIDVAMKIWGNNIAAMKGKTTRSKTDPVARDYVKVPNELLKLHKENIFFVNQITFLLTLSRSICFTAVNHLADRTVPHIFKAFKEMYQYYLQRGFHITMVHADGEFTPLKTLLESIPGGPMVNLASANEHLPEIKCLIRVVKEQCRATRAQSPVSHNPQAHDDPYCTQCRQAVEFFSNQGESVRHSKSKDYHVWRDFRLQEASDSSAWPVSPSPQVRQSS